MTSREPQPATASSDSSLSAALDHVRRGVELDDAYDELARCTSRLEATRRELERVESLTWTRIGRRFSLVPRSSRLIDKTPPTASPRPLDNVAEERPDDPHTVRRLELDEVHAQLELVEAQQRAAHEALRRLYASRWVKAGPLARKVTTRRKAARPHTTPSASATELIDQGQYEAALSLLDGQLVDQPRDVGSLRLKTTALVRLGELTSALQTARLTLTHRPAAHDSAVAETIAGRLRELDPTWLPDLGHGQALSPVPNRILHLLKESLPYYERGYTMRSHYVLKAQQEAGLDPSVVTSLGFPRVNGFATFEPSETIEGIGHHRLDLGPHYDYRNQPHDRMITDFARLASGIVDRLRPAVIHANSGYRGFETALVALALGRRHSIPVVYDVRSFLEATWTPDIDRSQQGEHYRLRLARELDCMLRADLVFTIADTMRDEIIRRGVPSDRVVVIPNAVDSESFQPRAPDTRLVSDLGFTGKTVFGYVSNIGKREGIDFLVHAVAEMIGSGRTDVAGLIVGDGPELPALRTLIDELGLGGVVHAVGHVEHQEVDRYYSVIDVFVVPRRNDEAARLVTPLKPYEAMAMGLPLLVADLPALVEVIGDGQRGRSFTAEDSHALATQAALLADDPALRARLAAEGRRWCVAERSWAQNGRRYIEAYARLGVETAC